MGSDNNTLCFAVDIHYLEKTMNLNRALTDPEAEAQDVTR